MDAVNNNNNTFQTAAKIVGAGAVVGAAVQGGITYARQRAALKNPDEFIRNATALAEQQKKWHTEFFDGTAEMANAAKAKIDEGLKQATEWVKAGKFDYGKIAKAAGKGAVIAGVTWGALYGIYKGVKHLLKGGAKVVAEGVNEANNKKAE